MLPEPVDPSEGEIVLQYDLKTANGWSCGGGYLKFLTADADFTPADLGANTPYTVMFGPDKCGSTNKVRGCCYSCSGGSTAVLAGRRRRWCQRGSRAPSRRWEGGAAHPPARARLSAASYLGRRWAPPAACLGRAWAQNPPC